MIVSNTTPISNLLHVKLIRLLPILFSQVHIPLAVADELNVVFANCQELHQAINDENIVLDKVSNRLFINHMTPFLHRGEIEAICLGLENNAKLCLMDDKDGREVAIMNNLPVTGTLGILLKAKNVGLISSIKDFVDELRTSNHFWVSEAMYQKVMCLAKE
jgi:predicted nucleic acid-binding protein